MSNAVKIRMVEGNRAPKYPTFTAELNVEEVVITEQGTEAHLPIVDFVLSGPGGEMYLVVLTGRIVNAISAAVRGSNMRNHGTEEP